VPDERKQQSLDINITGSVDSSLARAIGVTESQLAKLRDAVNTINKGFSKEAFGNFDQVNRNAQTLEGSLHRIGETAAGVTLGEAFMTGLEHAAELVDRMVEGLIEFGKQSLEVRAGREVMQNQLKAMLESLGKQSMGPQIDMLIRNMEGRQTMIRYDQLMKTVNLLLSSAPQRFAGLDAIQKMLSQLSDVSKDVSTFDLATHALTRILAEGKVDAQHLNELSIDTGYAFKKAMADALKVSPEELSDMMKKHALPGEQAIDALLKAFDLITGPGGAAYKHAEAQLSGLEGLWARFLGHWADFQESFGKQLETFIQPVAEAIFKHLTPAELTHAFDGLDQIMKDFGGKVAALVDTIFQALQKVNFTELNKSLSGLGDALMKAFGVEGGADQWEKILQGLSNALADVVKGTTAVINVFEKLFGWTQTLNSFIETHPFGGAPAGTQEDAASARQKWKAYSDLVNSKAPQDQIDAAKKEYDDLIKSMTSLEKQTKKAAGNDFVHLNKELDTTIVGFSAFQAALGQVTAAMAAMPMPAGGMMGGGVVGGGGPNVTEYGPGVPGDQPGGATYDYNSYHRVGAWPGITGPLRPGDVALGYGAQAHYHVQPGQVFTDDQGRTVRFADRSGSKNPMNEDIFRLAGGGIVNRATRALIGESGPEAVVPLNQGGLVTLHYSPTIHGFGDIGGLLREHADELLRQVEHALSSRFSAMANV
jgi:hypothetical protein